MTRHERVLWNAADGEPTAESSIPAVEDALATVEDALAAYCDVDRVVATAGGTATLQVAQEVAV